MIRMGEYSKKAAMLIEEQGLPFWDKPTTDVPDLPRDITSLSDEDLMTLFSELTSWMDYAYGQYAAAAIDERNAEKRYDRVFNLKFVAATLNATKADRIAILKAQVMAEDEVVDAEDEKDKAYAYRKLVESIANNLERDAALVSRELSRRNNEFKGPRKDRYTL